MTTFTEIVATVVVHSSAMALSHFGVTLEPTQAEKAAPPPVERVVARTPPAPQRVMKLTSCPEPRRHAYPLKT
jgi:hypothetical protein